MIPTAPNMLPLINYFTACLSNGFRRIDSLMLENHFIRESIIECSCAKRARLLHGSICSTVVRQYLWRSSLGRDQIFFSRSSMSIGMEMHGPSASRVGTKTDETRRTAGDRTIRIISVQHEQKHPCQLCSDSRSGLNEPADVGGNAKKFTILTSCAVGPPPACILGVGRD